MKNILIIATVILIFSCNKEDDSSPTTNNQSNQSKIESLVIKGEWYISNFNEDGNDKTSSFSDYLFTFHQDGSVSVNNSTNNYNGIWNINDSNSSDDSKEELHFNLLFTETNNLQELNDDWEILNYSELKISLQDISGGNGGIDFLVFEKK